jgi:signal transduction histidine kinase
VLLLLVTFAVTITLAVVGKRAADKNLTAYHKLLGWNAAYAAQSYTEQLSQTIPSLVLWILSDQNATDPLTVDVSRLRPKQFDKYHETWLRELCDCDPKAQVLYNYAYDYKTDQLVSDGNLNKAQQARIKRALTDSLAGLREGWKFNVSPGRWSADDGILLSAVRQEPRDTLDKRLYAVGIAVRPTLMQSIIWDGEKFNLAQPVTSDDTVRKTNRYAVALRTRSSETIYQHGTASQFAQTNSIESALGGLEVKVAIAPDELESVAGMSKPSLPSQFLVGLLLLAGLLIMASLFLTKQQGALAQARTDFVTNVSHELRTPLAQIRMFAETLLLGRVRNDTERRRSLEIIDQEAKRLTALVDNVLTHARGERGISRVNPTETALAPSVRETLDAFARLPRSMNVDFRMEVEDRLMAMVDLEAFNRILNNLLDNAVKYGPSGQRVNVGLAMFEQHARLWVDDEGPGIPARERERVFEPFFRSSLHAQSDVAGSGIGLAVVKELTGLLEGRVWAEGAPGGGARIVVEFPNAYLRPEEAAGSWAVA